MHLQSLTLLQVEAQDNRQALEKTGLHSPDRMPEIYGGSSLKALLDSWCNFETQACRRWPLLMPTG